MITLFFDGATRAGSRDGVERIEERGCGYRRGSFATPEAKAEETKANVEFTKLFMRRVSGNGVVSAAEYVNAALPAIRLGLPRARKKARQPTTQGARSVEIYGRGASGRDREGKGDASGLGPESNGDA